MRASRTVLWAFAIVQIGQAARADQATAVDICAAFSTAIEDELKGIPEKAELTATELDRHMAGPSGAAFSVEAQSSIANSLQIIAINLSLMRDQSCEMPREPLLPDRYEAAYSVCLKTKSAEACDRSKWKPYSTRRLK